MVKKTTKIKPDWWLKFAMGEIQELRMRDCTMSIIAGGAVRDFELNRYPRDIDVFVTNFPTENISSFGYQRHIVQGNGGSFSVDGGGDILHIEATFEKKVEYPSYERSIRFNLIKIKDDFIGFSSSTERDKREEFAEKIIKTFDFGINKSAITEIEMNLNNEPITTQVQHQDFNSDIKYNTLTIRMSEFCAYNNIRRLPFRSRKMGAYFPNHKIRIL